MLFFKSFTYLGNFAFKRDQQDVTSAIHLHVLNWAPTLFGWMLHSYHWEQLHTLRSYMELHTHLTPSQNFLRWEFDFLQSILNSSKWALLKKQNKTKNRKCCKGLCPCLSFKANFVLDSAEKPVVWTAETWTSPRTNRVPKSPSEPGAESAGQLNVSAAPHSITF